VCEGLFVCKRVSVCLSVCMCVCVCVEHTIVLHSDTTVSYYFGKYGIKMFVVTYFIVLKVRQKSDGVYIKLKVKHMMKLLM